MRRIVSKRGDDGKLIHFVQERVWWGWRNCGYTTILPYSGDIATLKAKFDDFDDAVSFLNLGYDVKKRTDEKH